MDRFLTIWDFDRCESFCGSGSRRSGKCSRSNGGGVILGLAEILSTAFLPTYFSEYRDGIVFAILILVLLVRPSGIMGVKEEVRV